MHLAKGVFWRKSKSFNALVPDEPYFFLKRGRINGKRYVVGYASFVQNIVLRAEDAWDEYGVSLGARRRQEFIDSVKEIYNDFNVELGCIMLDMICFFKQGILLEDCGIDFSPVIVSGKILDENDYDTIFQSAERGKSSE